MADRDELDRLRVEVDRLRKERNEAMETLAAVTIRAERYRSERDESRALADRYRSERDALREAAAAAAGVAVAAEPLVEEEALEGGVAESARGGGGGGGGGGGRIRRDDGDEDDAEGKVDYRGSFLTGGDYHVFSTIQHMGTLDTAERVRLVRAAAARDSAPSQHPPSSFTFARLLRRVMAADIASLRRMPKAKEAASALSHALQRSQPPAVEMLTVGKFAGEGPYGGMCKEYLCLWDRDPSPPTPHLPSPSPTTPKPVSAVQEAILALAKTAASGVSRAAKWKKDVSFFRGVEWVSALALADIISGERE